MSYPNFPKLAGLQFPIVQRPIFNNLSEQAAAGNEYRTNLQQWAIYEFDLSWDYLSPADYLSLKGLFLSSGGNFSPFYFDHLNDDTIPSASPYGFGVGDGSTTVFQLLKSVGSYIEPIGGTTNNWGTNPATQNVIYDNGTPVSAASYSASDGGAGSIITFNTPPASGHALTWSGTYLYLCRFKEPKLDLAQFMNLMYEQKGTTLVT